MQINKILSCCLQTERSNMRHRPIGIGVQGLADAFILSRFPFDSPAAKALNIQIFETLYYGALEASAELAEKLGPYETYEGSPSSKGILQYDMWGVTPTSLWDWAALKAKIARVGLRNSLLLAPMPTASTAQILGNNESIEAYTSNIYTRRVLSGEFQVKIFFLISPLIALVSNSILSIISDREPTPPEGPHGARVVVTIVEERVDRVQRLGTEDPLDPRGAEGVVQNGVGAEPEDGD